VHAQRLLVEREVEDAALEHAVAQVLADGRGTALLVEGEPGIGKSELLARAAARASGAGLHVWQASGAVLERDFGYGVVRQLFERHLRQLPAAARDRLLAGAAAPARSVFDPLAAQRGEASALEVRHALFWLLDGLTARRPAAVVIDDAQWADVASLRWLAHAARRLSDVPVLLVVALRSGEPTGDVAAVDVLRAQAGSALVRPGALSEAGVLAVAADVLGAAPAPALVRACRATTGGNPLYLHELLRAVAHETLDPTRATEDQLSELGGQRLAERTVRRLEALGAGPRALAEAVAVLESAALRHAAALARLDLTQAEEAADALAQAGLLTRGRPLRFPHDILRAAVVAHLPSAARAAAHRRAAVLLADDPERADETALHLLRAEPAGDAWSVEQLRAAAERARQRRAPDEAVRLLHRALAEPAGEQRPEVLAELGRAGRLAGHQAAAIPPLREALLAVPAALREQVTRDLAYALMLEGQAREAARVVEAALDANPLHPDARLRLSVDLGIVAIGDAGCLDRAIGQVLDAVHRAAGAPDPSLLGILAYLQYWTAGAAADEAAELVEQALAGGLLDAPEPELFSHVWPVLVLWHADRVARARELLSQVLERASLRGALSTRLAAEHLLSRLLTSVGELEQAEAIGLAALRSEPESLYRYGQPALVGGLLTTLVARGRVAAAQELLDAHDPGPDVAPTGTFHAGRIALRTAQGRHGEAVADARQLLRRLQERRHAGLRLHAVAADAMLAAGDASGAEEVAVQGLVSARRWGASSAIAPLHRVLGLARGDEHELRRAVELLDDSPLVLDQCRALLELGAHLRRAGSRAAAREPLRRALGLAHQMRAQPLLDRADEELRACGGRPRRTALSGVDSLTPSELRVGALAAQGLSNPRIAEALFISRATVESHLRNLFRKLGITSRDQISAILEHAAKSQGGSWMRELQHDVTLRPTR
jgi:DNA-binding CsgD family transcriptional regulator